MSKGSWRRPKQITGQEEALRWLYADGLITFREYEKRYKELHKQGLIKRSGKVIK